MRNFISRVGSVLMVCAAISGMISLAYLSMVYDYHKVRNMLEAEGYTEIHISRAWINRSPIQCSDENVAIFVYEAIKDQQHVSGFACSQSFPYRTKHWDD